MHRVEMRCGVCVVFGLVLTLSIRIVLRCAAIWCGVLWCLAFVLRREFRCVVA